MKLDINNRALVHQAVHDKKTIEIDVEREDTHYATSEAPVEWAECAPSLLNKQDMAYAIAYTAPDLKGQIDRWILLVYATGGKIFYKAKGLDLVSMRIEWPETATAAV